MVMGMEEGREEEGWGGSLGGRELRRREGELRRKRRIREKELGREGKIREGGRDISGRPNAKVRLDLVL